VYNLAADETRLEHKKLLMIDVVNGKRAGGGFHIAPLSEPDDGLLDVIIINALHPLLRLRWLPVIEKGQHLGLSFIHHSRTRKIYIESKSLIQAHLDGEYYTAASLDIEILPGKLLFYY
jgi:diacylglycerol kinase (ATP)